MVQVAAPTPTPYASARGTTAMAAAALPMPVSPKRRPSRTATRVASEREVADIETTQHRERGVHSAGQALGTQPVRSNPASSTRCAAMWLSTLRARAPSRFTSHWIEMPCSAAIV